MKGQLADTICETQKSTEISSKITPENEISKIWEAARSCVETCKQLSLLEGYGKRV